MFFKFLANGEIGIEKSELEVNNSILSKAYLKVDESSSNNKRDLETGSDADSSQKKKFKKALTVVDDTNKLSYNKVKNVLPSEELIQASEHQDQTEKKVCSIL